MLGLEPRNPEGADLQSAAVAAVPHPQLPYSCLMRSISVRLKRKQWNVTTRSRACQQKRSNTRVRAYLHHSLTSTCALACCSNAGSIPTHMKRARCRRARKLPGASDRNPRSAGPTASASGLRPSRAALGGARASPQLRAFAGSIPTHMKRARCRQRQRARKLPGASDRNPRSAGPTASASGLRPSRAALGGARASPQLRAFAGSIPTHMKRARCRQRQRARKLPGASDRNRTCNPLITNQLLYR